MKRKIANIVVIGVGAVRKIPLRRFAYLLWLRCGRVLDLKKQCRQQAEQAPAATLKSESPIKFRGRHGAGNSRKEQIMKTIISILIAALLGAGIGVGLAYGWRLYDDSRYVCNYTTATVGVGGTVYDLALKYLKKQDRYDLDEMIFYIIEENGLGNSRYMLIQPGDVLRIPLYTLKK